MFKKIKALIVRMAYPLYLAYTKTLKMLVSRKMLIFGVSAYLLTQTYLPPEYFTAIALAVLGVQTFLEKGMPKTNFWKPKELKQEKNKDEFDPADSIP